MDHRSASALALAVLLTFPALARASHEGPGEGEAVPAETAPAVTRLSPGVRSLLAAEMAAIQQDVAEIVRALPAGEWDVVAAAAARVEATHVVQRSLTPEQRRELRSVLPESFKLMDREFHGWAARLGAAAGARDHRLAAVALTRMVEGCTSCHAEHATHRFPALRDAAAAPER